MSSTMPPVLVDSLLLIAQKELKEDTEENLEYNRKIARSIACVINVHTDLIEDIDSFPHTYKQVESFLFMLDL